MVFWRVVIVSDRKQARQELCRGLRKRKLDVIAAERLDEALTGQDIAQRPPHLCLVDGVTRDDDWVRRAVSRVVDAWRGCQPVVIARTGSALGGIGVLHEPLDVDALLFSHLRARHVMKAEGAALPRLEYELAVVLAFGGNARLAARFLGTNESGLRRRLRLTGMYAASVLALCRCFAPAVDGGAGLAVRAPLSATHESDPAHDFAITSSVDSVSEGRPPPLLVADVTASALSRRLRVMLSARAGVPEHWVVRLGTGVIEAHRQPRDGAYAEVVEHAPGTSFSPLAFPDVRVEVSGVVSRFAGKITAGGS